VGSISLIIIFYQMFKFNRRVKEEVVHREHKSKPLHEIYDFS